jgi:hypothetical protein
VKKNGVETKKKNQKPKTFEEINKIKNNYHSGWGIAAWEMDMNAEMRNEEREVRFSFFLPFFFLFSFFPFFLFFFFIFLLFISPPQSIYLLLCPDPGCHLWR